ncbi:hypothetical protein [Humibacillus sp. DSM 29435]|uniref:hypothetical protein n=1 Tax=Humibacillus sp. DSM 29435 TaxID=1869167 RepID=UPI001C30DCC8|nr:hypothetical protein [Humibacillus sp. DSM 29435]
MTQLEDTLPQWDFTERHSRWIDAQPGQVWEALTTLRLEDLTLTRPLVAVRHLGSSGTKMSSSLFQDGPVTMLRTDPPCYAVGGAIAKPWQPRPDRRVPASLSDFASFTEPGWVKYLTDFRLIATGHGTRLVTVTRGVCTDAAARRRFKWYWAAIRPASGLVRKDILWTTARWARAGA